MPCYLRYCVLLLVLRDSMEQQEHRSKRKAKLCKTYQQKEDNYPLFCLHIKTRQWLIIF
jgi:hypothetical protein